MTPEAPADSYFELVKSAVRQGPPYEIAGLVVLLLIVYATSSNIEGALVFLGLLVFRDFVMFGLMKVVGASDARLMTLPLVRGELPAGTSAGREAALILGSPATMVVLSVLTYVAMRVTGSPLAREAMGSSIALAAFTLLPLKPYNGWRLLNVALFRRSAVMEMVVAILTSVILGVIALAGQMWILAGFALLNIMTSKRGLTIEKAAAAFRASGFQTARSAAELPDEGIRALLDATTAAFPESIGQRKPEQVKICAQLMREVHGRAGMVTPSIGTAVLLVTVYGALIVYFLIALVVMFGFKT